MGTLSSIRINRAPVLTLWAAVVAERLGHDRACALTLGKAVAGLTAQSKGRRLGLFTAGAAPTTKGAHGAHDGQKPGADPDHVELCGRLVAIVRTPDGVRAVTKGAALDPASVEKALAAKFGDALEEVRAVMLDLARAYPPGDLSLRAFALYEQFRPEIPRGAGGWGAKGTLELGRMRAMATRARSA
jgi:hypothetical protein